MIMSRHVTDSRTKDSVFGLLDLPRKISRFYERKAGKKTVSHPVSFRLSCLLLIPGTLSAKPGIVPALYLLPSMLYLPYSLSLLCTYSMILLQWNFPDPVSLDILDILFQILCQFLYFFLCILQAFSLYAHIEFQLGLCS